MTNPFIQAHDNIKAQIELARQVEREKLKPVLAEAFAKVPWLKALWFNTEQSWNDENYYTPSFDQIGLKIWFNDDREECEDWLRWYNGKIETDYNDADYIQEQFSITLEELVQLDSAFKDLFINVSGDVVDQIFGIDNAWIINYDGTITPYEEAKNEDDE